MNTDTIDEMFLDPNTDDWESDMYEYLTADCQYRAEWTQYLWADE